ncbi:MAG: hypothetical protein Phog2KO_49510 [Phototrophicaceae bacterium]
MVQTTIPPYEQRIIHAQDKGKELIYGILIGMSIVIVVIWIGSTLFTDTEGYLTNIFTEVISVIATIFVIDRINQWRDDRRLKNQLLEELRSSSISPAVNALDRLRREGWLMKNYFITDKGRDLQRANWEGAYIGGINLENADLRRTNLRKVINYDGKLNQLVNFTKSDLFRANLEYANLENAQFSNAKMEYANLSHADFYQATFEYADLRYSQIKNSFLAYTNFSYANLEHANLENTSLVNTYMLEAILSNTNLQNTALFNSDLRKANLQEANLQCSDLQMANLEGANCQLADFSGASLLLATLDNVDWAGKFGNYPAIMPDGTMWNINQDLGRFVLPFHADYKATLEKINKIRANKGLAKVSSGI